MVENVSGFRRISDGAVQVKTEKGWEEWFEILDNWGAREKGHAMIAKHLSDEYGLGPWWSQAIAIRYEWARGLRR